VGEEKRIEKMRGKGVWLEKRKNWREKKEA